MSARLGPSYALARGHKNERSRRLRSMRMHSGLRGPWATRLLEPSRPERALLSDRRGAPGAPPSLTGRDADRWSHEGKPRPASWTAKEPVSPCRRQGRSGMPPANAQVSQGLWTGLDRGRGQAGGTRRARMTAAARLHFSHSSSSVPGRWLDFLCVRLKRD